MSDLFGDKRVSYGETRLLAFWNRHYVVILSALFLILLASTLLSGYRLLVARQAESASTRYEALRVELRELDPQAEVERLEQFIIAEPNGYGVLAQYRRARSYYRRGDWQAAVDILRSITQNGFMPLPVRDFARLSAAYAMIDHMPTREIAAWLDTLLSTDHPMHAAASEIMGAALFLDEDYLEARHYLQQVQNSPLAGEEMQGRAKAMLGAIRRHLNPSKIDTAKAN